MSREIKFRAWVKHAGFMGHVEELFLMNEYVNINLDEDPEAYCVGNSRSYIFDKVEIMQFTGLHDKNGAEVFEGDVVKGKDYNDRRFIGEVIFDSCQWYLKGVKQYKEYHALNKINYNFEIIGNIHQQPELLK